MTAGKELAQVLQQDLRAGRWQDVYLCDQDSPFCVLFLVELEHVLEWELADDITI